MCVAREGGKYTEIFWQEKIIYAKQEAQKKGKTSCINFLDAVIGSRLKKRKKNTSVKKFSIGFSLSQITSGVRIEIIADQEGDCNFPDSRIGFGGGGSEFENACENGASWSAENGDKNIKAFGYIFVQ